MAEIVITTPDDAREVYRHKQLRQALYDAGEVVMEDVVVNLHGDEHRQRRRLENRLFRRDTFYEYEREMFPSIIQETVHPYLEDGRAELVDFGHQLMMNLAAKTAGVDRPLGTYEETSRLYDYLTTFIEGATLGFYTGDVEAKRAEIEEKLKAFDREFLEPGIALRTELLERFERGEIYEDELPRDVLQVLLRNQDKVPMTRESLRREIAFYLLAGAHTSATALTRVVHNIFKWLEDHPEDRDRAYNDKVFLQRATHETIRLQPSSPTAARWALEHLELKSGIKISEGDKVIIDLETVNRSQDLYGDDASEFNPNRELQNGVTPWGLSFGQGMHACIGQDLAAGLVFDANSTEEDHLFGLVPVAVQTLFLNGCKPDPDNPPEMDDSTTRPYFGKYPVVFEK
ncbi:MAG: cytochrome P450 [Acidimicrobiaceae bacterium TMED130]|nr:MAG: cytochrome P450 [Acidimicrobiaceae bacterium TMED130]|tara:strand:+ start:1693 stop:2895 length:1203 start_codon:yes stop_codon:yes gene_type:complete